MRFTINLLLFLFVSYAKSQTITAGELIEFINRGFSYTEVFFQNSSSWSSYSTYNSGFEIAGVQHFYPNKKNWETSTFVDGYYFYQKIEIFEFENTERLLTYQTNSEKKFNLIINSLKNKSTTSLKTNSISKGLLFLYSNNYFWSESRIINDYSIDNSTFTLYLYKKDFVENIINYETQKAIDIKFQELINSNYDEKQLRYFMNQYPNFTKLNEVKEKLMELLIAGILKDPNLAKIEQYTNEFPNSKYAKELALLEIDLELSMLKKSRDIKSVLNRIEIETNYDIKARYMDLFQDLSYGNFYDSFLELRDIDNIYNFVCENEFRFYNTKYKLDISKLKEKSFFDKICFYSISLMDPKTFFLQFDKSYPNSTYNYLISDLKGKIISDNNNINKIKHEKLKFDSLSLLKVKNYDALIASCETIIASINYLKLQVWIDSFNQQKQHYDILLNNLITEFKFIQERRSKIYKLSDINFSLNSTIKIGLENYLSNTRHDLRNLSFGVTYNFFSDTFGKYNVSYQPLNNYSLPPRTISKKLHNLFDSLYSGPQKKFELPVMTELTGNITFTNKSTEYQFIYNKKGVILDKNSGDITLPIVYKNLLTNTFSSNTNYKTGIYNIHYSYTEINSKTNKELVFDSYKSFSGLSAIIPAIIIPGTGLRMVTGKKQFWMTAMVYGMSTVSLYKFYEATESYNSYQSANNADDAKFYYNEYLTHRDNALLVGAGALGIYSVNLTYVIFRGIANNSKTLKYNKLYRNKSISL